MEFNFDGTQILSSSLDCCVKIHGLRSKRLLKEFVGHTSFVNSAIYSYDNNYVITGSTDGTLRIWDSKTTNCQKILKNLSSLSIEPSTAMTEYLATMYGSKISSENNSNTNKNEIEMKSNTDSNNTKNSNNSNSNSNSNDNESRNDCVSIRHIMVNPNCKNHNEIFVINESLIVYVINIKDGHVVRTIQSTKLVTNYLTKQKAAMQEMALSSKSIGQQSYQNSFIDACLSCRAGYLYVLAQDCVVYVFSTATSKLLNVIKVHENDVLGIRHHPHRNILASYSKDRSLKVWRP